MSSMQNKALGKPLASLAILATTALSFSARVENLFDKQYDAVDSSIDSTSGEVLYYNTADRRFFVGASYQF